MSQPVIDLQRQTGAVVLAALVIAALATLAAVALVTTQSRATNEVSRQFDRGQALGLARAGTAWAAAILRQDERQTTLDTLQEPWAQPLPPTRVEEVGLLQGQLFDQQGRFNLTNLVTGGAADTIEAGRFAALLTTLNLPTSLVNDLIDWQDADEVAWSQAGSSGKEGSQPGGSAFPNRPLSDLSELATVPGFSATVIARLAPYVTVIPAHLGKQRINVNTAPLPVLMALVPGMTEAEARTVIEARIRIPFKDVADFATRLPRAALQNVANGTASASAIDTSANKLSVDQSALRVTSEHFLLNAHIRYGDAALHVQAQLWRAPNTWPVVLWQRVLPAPAVRG